MSFKLSELLALICLSVSPLALAQPAASKPTTNPWGLKTILATGPALPHVLLIGDSILNGYHTAAADLLRDHVNLDVMVTPKHVGGIAGDLKAVLESHAYDVILFNDIGLHAWQPGRIADGQYEPLLRAHLDRLHTLAPKAKLIFATTTPILTKTKPYALDDEKNAVVIERNAIARRVMDERHVPVVDFYAELSPTLDQSAGDAFHWTKPAYARIARLAAVQIGKSLGFEAKP